MQRLKIVSDTPDVKSNRGFRRAKCPHCAKRGELADLIVTERRHVFESSDGNYIFGDPYLACHKCGLHIEDKEDAEPI